MNHKGSKVDRVITHLEKLRANEESGRAAMAILRRGVSGPPGQYYPMFRFLAPFLSESNTRREDDIMFLVASLYALHPTEGGKGNLGDAFHTSVGLDGDRNALERRFSILLSADAEDLPNHLRHAITFLRTRETPVDWRQLYEDVRAWDHPDGYVQRNWARAFWRQNAQASTETAPGTVEAVL